MAGIRALNFDRTAEYSHCERCDFRSHCWPEGLPVTTTQESSDPDEE